MTTTFDALRCSNTLPCSDLRVCSEQGLDVRVPGTFNTGVRAVFNCSAGAAYAVKRVSGAARRFEVTVLIPTGTKTALETTNPEVYSADVLEVQRTTGGSPVGSVVAVQATNDNGTVTPVPWLWIEASDHSGPPWANPLVSFGTAQTITTTLTYVSNPNWSVDTTVDSVAAGPTVTGLTIGDSDPEGWEIRVGGRFPVQVANEIYDVTSVRVFDSGSTILFSENFATGDFSRWDSTTGNCSVVGSIATRSVGTFDVLRCSDSLTCSDLRPCTEAGSATITPGSLTLAVR